MRTMRWFSRPGLSLVLAAVVVLIGMAAGQPARAAPGYWRFTGYGTSPPQSQLDETDRGTRAMGRTSETRVTGAFQPASSGAGSVDLFFKNDNVDRKIYLTTLKFSFTTGVEMRALTQGQKIHFNGVLVMGGNALSKALPASGSGTIAAGNGDYFVTTNGAIDQSASGEGDFVVPNGGGAGDTLTFHAGGHLGSYGGLSGRIDINYEWVAGPAPQLSSVSGGAAGAAPSGGHADQSRQPPGPVDGADVLGSQLQVSEGDGRSQGVWTRRPGTNIFDAQWGEITDVIRLQSLSGNRVVFTRDGNGGTYTGTISSNGRSISGTASWYQPGWTWTAQIGGGGQAGARNGHDNQPPQTEQLLADVGNPAACGVTDTSTLDLSLAAHVTRVDIWYHWGSGESSVGYTLSGGGRRFTSGVLSRAECDPYQTAWCVARGAPDVTLAPGRYEFRLDRPSICQNAGSGGAGFIKAWGYGR